MISIESGTSVAKRSLAAPLIAAVLALPGCGGGPAGQAQPGSATTPDQQAKQSRDLSRAQYEKTKGRPVRH